MMAKHAFRRLCGTFSSATIHQPPGQTLAGPPRTDMEEIYKKRYDFEYGNLVFPSINNDFMFATNNQETIPTSDTTLLPTNEDIERKAFTHRLRPLIRLLQATSYLPGTLKPRKSCLDVQAVMLLMLSLGAIGINGYLCAYTVRITVTFNTLFGMLHAATITSIITGLKPLINVVALGIFLMNLKRHRKLLEKLDELDYAFERHFGKIPNVAVMNRGILVLTALVFIVPGVTRAVEFNVLGNRLGRSLLSDVSLVLVPLLSVWNLLPLFYYHYMNVLLRYWSALLKRQLKSEVRVRHRPLKFYYEQFLNLTSAQECVGKLFNPFVLMSLGWSLFTLCLSIYFATQAQSTMDEPPDQVRTEADRAMWYRTVHFNMCWSAMQIAVALTTIITICANGTSTNEETRKILSTVLSLTQLHESDSDKLQLAYFVHKTNTQYMWGMSVWRAFPLERSAFFTIISIIITYAFLLLKLKDFRPPNTPVGKGNLSLALNNDTQV